jgi:hypothetical protein
MKSVRRRQKGGSKRLSKSRKSFRRTSRKSSKKSLRKSRQSLRKSKSIMEQIGGFVRDLSVSQNFRLGN